MIVARLRALGQVSALLLTAGLARAQDAATVAEGLFREGAELLRQGNIDVACIKLAESQRLDASAGTLLNLGDCRERQGKLATAWNDFISAERLASRQGRADVAAEARRRAALLEPKLSYLIIHLSQPVSGVSVKLDSVALEASALGSRLPIDPGQRLVVVVAPGHEPLELAVPIRAAETKTLNVPPLRRRSEPSAPKHPAATPAPPAAAQAGPSRKPNAPISAYLVGGGGIAALGVGGAFALLSRSAYTDAEAACPTHAGCSEHAMSRRNTAELRANVANVAFGVGVIGLGASALLFVTNAGEPPRTRSKAQLQVAPALHDSGAGVALWGSLF